MGTIDIEKGTIEPTPDECSVKGSVCETEYREYRYRFVIMALYFGISVGNQILWVTCAPITSNLQEIYGVSQLVINLTSSLTMLLHIPITIPENYILDVFGIKKGLYLGTALTLAGVWLRMLAGISFYFVLLGQLIAAFALPLLYNCPQKITAYWVAPKKRTIFTTLLTIPSILGTALGFYLPGLIVGSESSPTKGKELFLRLLLIEAIITTVLGAPLFIFFKEKPPTPPSSSAEVPREHFKQGMKAVFKNKSFLLILVVLGIGIGALNSIGTVIESLIVPFGFSQVDAGNLGIIMIFLGLVGSVTLGVFVEKTRKYKATVAVCILAVIAAFGALIGLLFTRSMIAVSLMIGITGFFLTALLPLGLEFAAEVTFPVGEATSGGLLLLMSMIVGAALIFIVDGIMTIEDKKKGAIISICMFIGWLVLAFVASVLVPENLIRSKHDATKSNTKSTNLAHPRAEKPKATPTSN